MAPSSDFIRPPWVTLTERNKMTTSVDYLENAEILENFTDVRKMTGN